MFNARTAFRLACGDPPASGKRDLTGTATLTGAGFWGSPAHEDAAQNGIELGPLLDFEFTGGGCDPNHVTPTPVPTQPSLLAITVGVDVLPYAGAHPGDLVTGVVHTQPAGIEGLECTVLYASPPVLGSSAGTVLIDPALDPQTHRR